MVTRSPKRKPAVRSKKRRLRVTASNADKVVDRHAVVFRTLAEWDRKHPASRDRS